MTYFTKLFIYIINDIGNVMIFLPAGLMAFVAVNLLYWLVLPKAAAREHYKKALAVSLSIAYLVIILFITVFSRESGSRDSLDLLPFATMGQGPRNDAYVLENVLLFIPLGILLPCTSDFWQRFYVCALTGFLVSVLMELLQFLTKRGYAQTDDVITNTLGTIVGYMIFKGGHRFYKKYLINTEKNKNI